MGWEWDVGPELRGNQTDDFVEAVARPMLHGPAVDVTPVQETLLDGDHVSDILTVLAPTGIDRPAEFEDDDILRAW